MDTKSTIKNDIKAIKAFRNKTFNITKRLLNNLTTNQLLLLLPRIVDKLRFNTKNSYKKDFLLFASGQFNLTANDEGFIIQYFTNIKQNSPVINQPGSYKFEKIRSSSNSSQNSNNTISENQTLQFECSKASDTDHSDSTICNIKNSDKSVTKFGHELSEVTDTFYSGQDINANCQQLVITDENHYLDPSYIDEADLKSNDISESYCESYFESNLISNLDHEECVEVLNIEEIYSGKSFIRNFFQDVYQPLTKPFNTYLTECTKLKENHLTSMVNVISSNLHSKIINNRSTVSESDPSKGCLSNCLEVVVDLSDNGELMDLKERFLCKLNEEMSSNIKISPISVLNMKINHEKLKSLKMKKERDKTNESISTNSKTLAICNVKELSVKIDKEKSQNSLISHRKIKRPNRAKKEAENTMKTIKLQLPIWTILKSESRRKHSFLELKSPQSMPKVSNLSTISLAHRSYPLISKRTSLLNAYQYKQRKNRYYLGLSTSKVIDGRFQQGWQCTYKLCQGFNSLQRQTCKYCLNSRLCHPPVSKGDTVCRDCGYLNYKSRLYCKKCKFIFLNNERKVI